MSTVWKCFSLFCLTALLAGCASQLVYQNKYDDQKTKYYQACLEHEEKIQKKSIEGINTSLAKVEELCYVLYHRIPIRREQYRVLAISGKLHQLKSNMQTLAGMREKFNKIFLASLTGDSFSAESLKDQFSLQIEDQLDYLTRLRRLHALVIYLDNFRREATILTDLDEEKLQTFSVNFQAAEKKLQEIMFTKLSQKLTNVGKVISRDNGFSYSFATPAGLNVKLEDESLLLPGEGKEHLLQDVSDYVFYFEDEDENFTENFRTLRESTKRFRVAVEKMEEFEQSSEVSQLDKVTSIMEDMASQMESLFSETMTDLQNLVGENRKIVDETLWAQTKAENKQEKAKNNFDFYTQSVINLNELLVQTIKMENASSASKRAGKKLQSLGYFYHQKRGILGTGVDFLNDDWKEKTAFETLNEELNQELQELESIAQQGLAPLWRTCNAQCRQRKVKAPYKLSQGYLVENDE